MTEKRFGIIKTKTYGLYVPVDKMKVYIFSGFESELDCIRVVDALNELDSENQKLKNENEKLKQFKENVIKWVDSQMKFNVKKYIETEDHHFKSENVNLHNFKVFIGIDSND